MRVSKERFDKMEDDAARAMDRCDAFTDRLAVLGNNITSLRDRMDHLIDLIRGVGGRTMVGGHPVNAVVSALLEELGFGLEVSPEKLCVRKEGAAVDVAGGKNGMEYIGIDALSYEKLRRFLVAHENDIDDGINDFGYLRSVYISLLGVEPQRQ